jgi:hypothetical protein
MHFEVPSLPHSLKEFAAHYFMIVVSILTALGLEATVEHLHHQHAAEAAQRAIESELRSNLTQIRSSDADNLKRLKPLEALCDQLAKDFTDGVPEVQIKQRIAQHAKADIDMGLYYPQLRHEAWDVAVANQSASYMEPETLRRLSAAYAMQRDINLGNLAAFVNLPGFIDALTDAQVDAGDPHEFLRAMRQAAIAVRGTHQKLMYLDRELSEVLGVDGHAEAPTPDAHARAASA